MLRLKHLDISGFKTFVDPVSTEFAGGITAIVGPNGCGKSNYSEAITWVLGEQSAKSLRGGKMEDVIFSGSDTRRPLGMAEVNLVLETDQPFDHAQDGTIAIGRRVFRSGESQYRLNDKLVRLKEVKDLLMDTGLGIRAYSVIEQGRIGQILSGKPQERRKLIEEAAGITRYKARKRVAEIKLEEATGNLLRLDDIISEVERSLRSLKRQANAAVRYKEREAAYRELLEVVLLARAADFALRLAELRKRLAEQTDLDAKTSAELHAKDAGLAQARERLEATNDRLATHHRQLAELAATVEGRQEFIKGATTTLQEIAERLEQGAGLAGQREGEMVVHLETLQELDSKHRQLLEERNEAAAAVEEDRRRIARAEAEVAQAETRLEDLRSQLMQSIGTINALQNRLHQEQIESEKASFRRDHVTTELRKRRGELDQTTTTLAEAKTRLAGLEQRLSGLREERAEVQTRLDEILRIEKEASERRERTQRELVERRQRHELLVELEEAAAQRREALQKALAEQGITEPRYLDDVVVVPKGWESSLDLYLEQLRDAVLVPSGVDPLEAAKSLSEGRFHATFIRTGSNGGTGEHQETKPDVPRDPAILQSLGEALGVGPELDVALPPAYLVESAQDAARLARLNPGIAFLSRDRFWAQGGVLHVVGAEARPGALTRRRELQEIEGRLVVLPGVLARAQTTLAGLVGERSELATRANRLDDEIADVRQELAVAQARHQDVANRHAQITALHGTLEQEERKLGSSLALIDERRQQLSTDLTGSRSGHEELEARFDAVQAEVDQARERRETLRAEGAGRAGRLELLEERVDAHGSETRRLTQQRDDIRLALERWSDEKQSLTRRHDELVRARAEAETDLQAALEARVKAEEDTRSGQAVLEDERAAVRGLEVEVTALRERRDGQRSEIQELRVQEATLVQEREHVAEAYREAFHGDLPEELAPPPSNLEELEDELAERKGVLEKMGPVNVLAADEYAEAEERHVFLSEQRADVAGSVERLRKTIREINQTSSVRFRETFEEVNENFARIFADLFRGGEAEMRLLDEEDVLDSGIEIVARPPGKRPQNIMLLSGGEKALGAIALLFALFQTKPSPFCILDEVDAPLDDANILRFVQVLKDMARDTQFLIITHNKLTMEAAARLYGVTMEEKGVSKLVGVDLEDLHPEPQQDELQTA